MIIVRSYLINNQSSVRKKPFFWIACKDEFPQIIFEPYRVKSFYGFPRFWCDVQFMVY